MEELSFSGIEYRREWVSLCFQGPIPVHGGPQLHPPLEKMPKSPVNQHSYGTSPMSMGKSTISTGPCKKELC